MREVAIRLEFVTHSLGNNTKWRKFRTESGTPKRQSYSVFPRTEQGNVILLPQWWVTVLREAAQVIGRYHKEARSIRFALEVDGKPRALPEGIYKRYYAADKFSCHEAFYPGDVVGVTCLVPQEISDEGMWQLLETAGKYYGISPAKHEDGFGRFKVLSIMKRGPQCDEASDQVVDPTPKQEKPVA